MNHYRWFRGFNDYDNWQASGVSGLGARSFYYPPKSLTCGAATCLWSIHTIRAISMARSILIVSRRPILRYRFVNKDDKQLETTENFLKSGLITVDIFAVCPVTDDNRSARNGAAGRQRFTTSEYRLRGGRRGRAEYGRL